MKTCRLCGTAGPRDLIDLGSVPSIHILYREPRPVPLFPLHAYLCATCGLAQMPSAPAQQIYEGSQVYTTSHNAGAYMRDLIDALKAMRPGTKTLEIGCNDGAFLAAAKDAGFSPTIGIEPNHHARELAIARGLEIVDGFFSRELAAAWRKDRGSFDVIIARHVLEHVDDIVGFLSGVHDLLGRDGVFLLELPYVEPGFNAGAPNVLWDEHINYFPEPTVQAALENAGFHVEMRRFYTGGALVMALLARRTDKPSQVRWTGLAGLAPMFDGFADKVSAYRRALHDTIEAARRQGVRVALYGAGFRSATTIGTMAIGQWIDDVIDDRPDLSGYLMPGTSCPIRPLAQTATSASPVLILLGVGAEHERKVMAAAAAHFTTATVPLSLVYPGDLIALCQSAKTQITQATPSRAREH